MQLVTAFGPEPPSDDGDNVARLRVPPHSMEAEQSVLGGLLLDNRARERIVDALSSTDFYRHEHRVIFDAIGATLDAGQPADEVTVFERLQSEGKADQAGGMPYLLSLSQSVPSAANIRRYAEIVRERALLRRLIHVSDEIATAAFNPQGRPAQKILDEAENRVSELFREQHRRVGTNRVPLLRLEALQQASESVRWLIKRVVPAESIGMLFGGSGTFKSFIAIDAALHIAHGLPWMGRRTAQGSVLYIAAEGGAGLWRRIEAWHRARKMRWQDAPIGVVPVPVNLSTDAWRVVDAAQAISFTPSLVVVDTLSQTYAGEENSANEMAAYLRELGMRFRQLWQCAVLLIHHSGHLATERPRGSSAIRGNLDFLFGTFRDEKEMLATLTCMKQKDDDEFEDTTFALSPYTLGTDEDGDEVRALVARHLTSAEELDQAMSTERSAGRIGKNQLLLQLAQNGMKESELRKVFGDECGVDDSNSRRRIYNRAKQWATKAGFLEIASGVVITLKAKP